MKTEPDSFSISDLERVRVEPWSGVRNRMARNFMRKMSVGDGVLFYHSSTEPPGVAGLARVERINVIDETQFDPASQYFDPKATRDKPQWDCVDVSFVTRLPHYVSLHRMRADPALSDMVVLRAGRLSVQPVTEDEYRRVVALGDLAPPPGADKPAKKPTIPKGKSAGGKSAGGKSAGGKSAGGKSAGGKSARGKSAGESPARSKPAGARKAR